jgi:two-component system, OmpR family, phosphate regulon sensor histidine kinase PhoR
MVPLTSVTLLLNGLTLTLSLSFLLITLWQDTRKELNQLFALFLFMVTLWNGGSLVLQAFSLIELDSSLSVLAISVMELGYAGASVAIYTLTNIVVGTSTRRFRRLASLGFVIILGYQVILSFSNAPLRLEGPGSGAFTFQFQPLSTLIYLIFAAWTFYLAWRHRRRIRTASLLYGIMLFVTGQALSLLNPELQTLSISINVSSIAALIISFAILRQEIITPLADQVQQIEAMHKVSLAITSQISLNTVLSEIATQAAGWLDADGSGIFLDTGAGLELASVFNLPDQFVRHRLLAGQGMVGAAAATGQSIFVEQYARDWQGETDLPLARETFGSVICSPLIYGGRAIGVLMVIASRQGRLFSKSDVYLLDLLGAQAAVAIAHSQLFADQQNLMHEVDTARSQLEAVLLSTENPVVAINRRFQIIFANPAARVLFPIEDNVAVTEMLPDYTFPPEPLAALASLRRNRTHVYEITHKNKTYLCHLACLGRPRIAGWVAILNDVTQLKELDRLKSEMVRMTSHDLKNPLQAAMANLELLSDDLADVQDAEIHESLRAIDKQLIRMNRIIGGILDLERLKSGVPAFEICHIDQIVRHTIEELQDQAREKGIALAVEQAETLPDFLGDSGQFERALINVVENAIKFTPDGGNVRLSVDSAADEIVISVQDSGIGIPQEMHQKIFERFYRGRQKGADHVSGSGLGLSLVKTIIDNHNGRIWLESQEGCGTTFYIAVPSLLLEQFG